MLHAKPKTNKDTVDLGFYTKQFTSKLNSFVARSYGPRMKRIMNIPFEEIEKEEAGTKSKELLRQIVQREIAKLYKAPVVAFNELDYQGKGKLTINDFSNNSKIIYKLPITKEEFKRFLERDSIFKRNTQINLDQFTKNFFPADTNTGVQGGTASDSTDSGDDGDSNNMSDGGKPATTITDSFSVSLGGGSSIQSVRT